VPDSLRQDENVDDLAFGVTPEIDHLAFGVRISTTILRAQTLIARRLVNQNGFKGAWEENAPTLGFLDEMRVAPDHRIAGTVTYALDKILLTTLAG
jgi:hypothetical protein